MLVAFTWFVVLSLLALWSLTVWAGHAATVWALSHTGAVGDAASGLAGLQWPAWLAPWMPPETLGFLAAVAASVQPLLDGLVQIVPSLAGAVTVLAWGLWGLGAVLLLVLGAAGHLLAAVWRRHGPGAGRPPSAGLQAG